MEKFRKRKAESNEHDNDKTMLGYFVSRITKPLASFELDHEQRLEIERLEGESIDNRTSLNIIFNVLSQYTRYMSQFGVDLDTSKSILIYFCKRYQLDKDRTQLLLSELQASYTKQGMLPKGYKRPDGEASDDPNSALDLKHSDGSALVTLTSPLDENGLVLRKQLLQDRELLNREKRNDLWRYFLNLDDIMVDYSALRDKINQNPEIIERVEEVITLDVQRSFNSTDSISQETLSNILKTYAFYNPEIEYCQGMNFLAGFFYFYYQDEEQAFKAMIGLIHKFDLTELFNSQLTRLKLYFYILDRLISIELPELHEHLQNEHITASLFSSAWFIT